MLNLLIAIAAATQPTWLSAGSNAGISSTLSAETSSLLITQCTGGDAAALMGWLGTQTDSNNAQSPTKDQALGYCLEWATYMGPSSDEGNFVVAPMSQLGVGCAMYHCLENFFGFTATDIASVECVLSNVLTSFDGADTTFPESHGGADSQNYAKSSCACNTKLAAAAPSPAFPKWLTHTGTVRACASRLSWDPTNAPFWACSLRACMPKGEMKEYLICTQDTYYGFEGLDQCDKLDKLVLGNIAAPIPLAITGIVFFFLAMTLYGIVSICCSSKKSKEAKIGV
jgi:hypothetical protein